MRLYFILPFLAVLLLAFVIEFLTLPDIEGVIVSLYNISGDITNLHAQKIAIMTSGTELFIDQCH